MTTPEIEGLRREVAAIQKLARNTLHKVRRQDLKRTALGLVEIEETAHRLDLLLRHKSHS